MKRINKLHLVIALTLMSTGAHAVPMSAYTPSEQDREVLLALGEVPKKGMEYIRCERQHCYSLTTGEYEGNQPVDGIYLIWSIPENTPN